MWTFRHSGDKNRFSTFHFEQVFSLAKCLLQPCQEDSDVERPWDVDGQQTLNALFRSALNSFWQKRYA